MCVCVCVCVSWCCAQKWPIISHQLRHNIMAKNNFVFGRFLVLLERNWPGPLTIFEFLNSAHHPWHYNHVHRVGISCLMEPKICMQQATAEYTQDWQTLRVRPRTLPDADSLTHIIIRVSASILCRLATTILCWQSSGTAFWHSIIASQGKYQLQLAS